jgi:hypothetical protein
MGAPLALAGVLALIGIGTLFITPWVGGPLLLAAIVVAVAGLFLGGAAAASDADVVPDETGDAPHLPGPTGRETRTD